MIFTVLSSATGPYFAEGREAGDLRAIEAAGGWWVRFGHDLLVCSADARWRGVRDRIAGRQADLSEGRIRRNDMHLVVQKGRIFQREHPGVRVILDRGRYLVVEMPREAARGLSGRRDPCFRIEPLRANSTVFEARPPAPRGPVPEGAVAAVLAALSQAGFEAAVARLAAIHSRLSTGPGYAEAADWTRDSLAALGFEVTVVQVPMDAGDSSNVIATRAGSGGKGRGAVLVVAHLDSINHEDGPLAPAPGADDNASGAAGVLVLAAALAPHGVTHDLTFILFGGEEQGLHGSLQYVAALPEAERRRIRAVVNMDMIGARNTEPASVLLEGAELSRGMIDGLAAAAAQVTGLAVQTSLQPFASDHVPFIEAGIPAVLTIEGADGANEAIHTARDTPDRLEPAFAMEILRMNAAFVAAEVGLVAAAPADRGGALPAAEAVNLAAAQYQALFAQYARLHRAGALGAGEAAACQAARRAHAALAGGAPAQEAGT